MTHELTMAELGRRLGISTPMVCRLCKRGMPRDEAGARAWRSCNLNPLQVKARRIGGNNGTPYAGPAAPRMSPAELLELAEGIAALMEGDPSLFDEGVPKLRGVLFGMDAGTLDRVRLSPRVWRALNAGLTAE